MTLSFSNFAHVLVAVVVVLRSTDVHLAPLLLIIFLPTICSFLYTVEYSIFITSDLAFSVVIFTNHVTLVSCKSDWITQCSGFMLQWPLFHLPFYWMARWHSYVYIHVSRGKIIILCYYYNNKTVHVHVFFFLFLHSNSNCWNWKERNLFRQVRLEYMPTCANRHNIVSQQLPTFDYD